MTAGRIRIAAIAVAAVAMSGCHARHPATVSAAPTTPPNNALSASPAESTAAAQVLAAYSAMRAAEVRAFADPVQPHQDLSGSATGQALAGIEQTLLFYRRQRIVVHGQPRMRPRVTMVNLSARPWTATIVDCFDSAAWRPVLGATGHPVSAPGRRERYPVTASVRVVAGRWMVDRLIADRSRSC